MRYDEYLRLGLPIASGAVEGACRPLAKDGLERSDTRWSTPPSLGNSCLWHAPRPTPSSLHVVA